MHDCWSEVETPSGVRLQEASVRRRRRRRLWGMGWLLIWAAITGRGV